MVKRIFAKNIARSQVTPTIKKPVRQLVSPMYAKMSRRRDRLAQLRARPLVPQKEEAPKELTEEEIYKVDEYKKDVDNYEADKKQYEADLALYNSNPIWKIQTYDRDNRTWNIGHPRNFRNKTEVDEFIKKHRLDIADRDTPVGRVKAPFGKSPPIAPDKNKYIRKEVMDEYNKQESMRLYSQNVSPFLTDPGYLKDYNPDGSLKRVYKKPVKYLTWDEYRDRDSGPDWEKEVTGSYIPHAILFDTTGKLKSVVKRKKYQTYEMDYDDRGMDKYGVFDAETLVFGPTGLIKSKTVKDDYESNVRRKDRGTVTDYGIYTSEAWDFDTGRLIERQEPSARVKDKRTVIAPKKYVSSAGLSRAVFSESSGTWIPYGDSPEYKAKLAAQKEDAEALIQSGGTFYKGSSIMMGGNLSSIAVGGFKPSKSSKVQKKTSVPIKYEWEKSAGKEKVPTRTWSTPIKTDSLSQIGNINYSPLRQKKVQDDKSQFKLKTPIYIPPSEQIIPPTQYKFDMLNIMGGGKQQSSFQNLNLSNIMGNFTKVDKSNKNKLFISKI